MKLNEIPVAVVSGAAPGEALNAPALLQEIATLLERLADAGETGAIDLMSLPLSPADRERLEETLGEGEVAVEIEAAGKSVVRETAIHGVWWITHKNALDNVTAELIEVTPIPEIIKTHPRDILMGLETLRSRINPSISEGESDAG